MGTSSIRPPSTILYTSLSPPPPLQSDRLAGEEKEGDLISNHGITIDDRSTPPDTLGWMRLCGGRPVCLFAERRGGGEHLICTDKENFGVCGLVVEVRKGMRRCLLAVQTLGMGWKTDDVEWTGLLDRSSRLVITLDTNCSQ